MKRISRNIHSIIAATLFLGGAVVVFVLVAHMINTKGTALKERLRIIADEQVLEQQYVSLAKAIRETEEERQLLAGFVLEDERDTIDLLSTLDAIAKELGVTLSTQELREQDSTGAFNTLLLSYEIQGREDAVIKMSEMLETLPYHGHVTSFTLQRSAGEQGVQKASVAKISLEISIRNHDQ